MDKFTKQSAETLDYDFDFADALAADGDTVATAVCSVTTGTLVLGSIVINPTANVIKQWISGGTHGQTYKVTCLMTSTAGRTIEIDILIKVKDI